MLQQNDLGGWTKPAPRLYPHQWSWDSAFIAIGLAHVDPDRALRELEVLFSAQWADGRVPHIVFNPESHDYFPGADVWATHAVHPGAPLAPQTSGLIQPPVHALSAWQLARVAGEQLRPRLEALYPKLLAWHRYLARARDPESSGLLSIYHPWESGTDNSPRWDAALARIDVGDLPPYQRHDLKHVGDASERPTNAEYDRYLWLVERLKSAGYEDERVHDGHPFVIKDVLMSAIFALANDALALLARALGKHASDTAEIDGWIEKATRAVEAAWDPVSRLALDFDVRAGRSIHVRTCAGLAPILLPRGRRDVLESTVDELVGDAFAGQPGSAFAVIPSAASGSPGYSRRAYWRGPAWPFINWLYWWALRQHGFTAQADALREANMHLLDRPEAQFAEYFEPLTGEPLGSLAQSWTAAVALDWLTAGER
ncbi:MAG: hypothetical protein NVSMB2_02680 [Chloroflexota bacterium]